MLASIIYNYGKFCGGFKSTLKLGAYQIVEQEEKEVEKMRTLAFQVNEELFQKVKDYLRRNNMSQKEFVIGLIEAEIDRDLAEREALRQQKENEVRKSVKVDEQNVEDNTGEETASEEEIESEDHELTEGYFSEGNEMSEYLPLADEIAPEDEQMLDSDESVEEVTEESDITEVEEPGLEESNFSEVIQTDDVADAYESEDDYEEGEAGEEEDFSDTEDQDEGENEEEDMVMSM